MEIRNIFEKNITRPINGVIKVDQKDAHEKETLSEWIGDDFWIRYRRWLKNSRFICMEGERN